MFKGIRRIIIFSVGVGAGFGAGYLKATSDLDEEFLGDMRKIAKDFYGEFSEAVRSNVEENRKQTEIFATTAETMRATAANETTEPEGEPS